MTLDKRFKREFFAGMVLYMVFLFASIFWIKAHMDTPWRFAVALLPMLPLVFVARATVMRLQRMDEMMKQIQVTALAITVLVTSLVTLTYGFLENVGAPHVSVLWVWPLIGFTWGITSYISWEYYS